MVIMENKTLLRYLCRNLEPTYQNCKSWIFLTVKQNTQLDTVKLVTDTEMTSFYLLKNLQM